MNGNNFSFNNYYKLKILEIRTLYKTDLNRYSLFKFIYTLNILKAINYDH